MIICHAVIIAFILSLIILDLNLHPTDCWPMIMQQWVSPTNQGRGPAKSETRRHLISLSKVTGDSKAIYHHIMITAITENISALIIIRAQGKHHLRCAQGLRSVRARNYFISQIDFNADKSPIYWSSIHVLFLGNGIGGIWGKDAGRGLTMVNNVVLVKFWLNTWSGRQRILIHILLQSWVPRHQIHRH